MIEKSVYKRCKQQSLEASVKREGGDKQVEEGKM